MCHLNIRKHRPWAYILGFIELPYFGSEQFRKIYLVERICICICIWINVFVFVFVFESMLNKIFVFVFVFGKSKFLYLYLYLYLIKRIWPQPCLLLREICVDPFTYKWNRLLNCWIAAERTKSKFILTHILQTRTQIMTTNQHYSA